MIRSVYCLGLFLLAGCEAAVPETIDGAMQAYSQVRVAEAEAVFRKIAADPATSARDRAQAHRQLGRIAWHVDGDAGRALAEVRDAFAAGDEPCASASLEARVLAGAPRPDRLLARIEPLLKHCAGPELADRADRLRLTAAAALLDLAQSGRPGALDEAGRLLSEAGEDQRESLGGSAVALELGLLKGDAPSALKAWKDYFWLTDTDVPQALAGPYPAAAPLFEAGLAAGAGPGARLRLVDLLVRAGFARAAERFARAAGLDRAGAGDPLWRKASAYFEARRSLEAAILASNRRVARGGSAADLERLVDEATRKLMAGAGGSGDSKAALLRAYSLYGRVDDTGGYASVHLGHAIQMDRRSVEQYGHRAQVTFVALDSMLANGFESWLWDGSAAAGGWASEGPVIVQVRPEYTSTPLSGWHLFSTPPPAEQLRRTKESEAADAAALAGTDVAYLQGLADRLERQVAAQVGGRARAALAAGGDLRRAFLAEYWRASFQQSIFIHEGRHALDRTLVRGIARFNDTNLEYRAKLSELALADYPRLALYNINSQTIGGGTPHGKANAKVLQAYVDWMRGHAREIAGYDPKRPPLVQIDKLSDAQLRAVARSLDPIAR